MTTQRHPDRPGSELPRRGWLRCHRPRPSAPVRLVCFPHAGGSATFFRDWGAAAGPEIEVLAVQYPARADRLPEAPVDDVRAMARATSEALTRLDRRPTALFGHSLGAVVAYETARNLDGIDQRPVHLFASGRHAPGETIPGDIHLRDDTGLVADLVRLGGTPAGFLDDPEVRDVVLPAVRGDYRAAETYRHLPGPPLRCPITAVIGTEDPEVSAPQALRWADHTRAEFRLVRLPGAHFYLTDLRQQVVDLLAEPLLDALSGHATSSEEQW